MLPNKQYTFKSSVSTDFITITNALGDFLIASGTTPIAWRSGGYSGVIRYFIHSDSNCGAQPIFRTKSITCSNTLSNCQSPSNLAISNITSHSANVSWSAPAILPITGYQTFVSTSNLTPSPMYVANNVTANTSATFSNLSSNTTYYYWVRSICGGALIVGNWQLGGTFVTQQASNCNQATFGLYPDATFTPLCSGSPGLITTNTYAGQYSNVNLLTNKLYTFSSEVASDYITITNSTETVTLASGISPISWNSGINSGVFRYYIHTNSACGNQQTYRKRFITCSITGTACDNPTNLKIIELTSNSARISWTPPAPLPATSYQTYVSSNNVAPFGSMSAVNNLSTTNRSPLFNNLSPINNYYWVRSICGNNRGPWIAGGSFKTLPLGYTYCNGAFNGLFPETTFSPNCTGSLETIAANAFAGEYSTVNVLPGTNYTFTSSVATDLITITNDLGTEFYTSGTTPLMWNSGFNSGIIRYHIHESVNCASQNVNRIKSVKCGSLLNTDTFSFENLKLYPNPTKDSFNFDFTHKIDKIEITNMMGQEVKKQQIDDRIGNIDISTLFVGTYLVRFYANDSFKVFKIIK